MLNAKSLTFNDDNDDDDDDDDDMMMMMMMMMATNSKHNVTPSITQHNINAIGTEYQQIYNYFFPFPFP